MGNDFKFTSIIEDDYYNFTILNKEVMIDNSGGEYDPIYIDVFELKKYIDKHIEKLYIKEDE